MKFYWLKVLKVYGGNPKGPFPLLAYSLLYILPPPFFPSSFFPSFPSVWVRRQCGHPICLSGNGAELSGQTTLVWRERRRRRRRVYNIGLPPVFSSLFSTVFFSFSFLQIYPSPPQQGPSSSSSTPNPTKREKRQARKNRANAPLISNPLRTTSDHL